MLVLALLALALFFQMLTGSFLSPRSLYSILNQLPMLTVTAVGMSLVLVVGAIDLSVGAVAAVTAAVCGVVLSELALGPAGALVIGIVIGSGIGLLNGFLSAYLSLSAFIVTLGMLEAGRGLAYQVTGSKTIFLGQTLDALSRPIQGIGISLSVIISVLVVVAGHFLMSKMVLGRQLVAVGANETASRISGIRVRVRKLLVLTISGALAGLAGVFNAAYLGASDPNSGIGLELSAIAAAVIGGNSLMGGRVSVIGAFLGVLIISVLQSGLAQMGVNEPAKKLITGAVIILAVLADQLRQKDKR